jgi:hypothetical protein
VAVDRETLSRMIADLNGDRFPVREKAAGELLNLAGQVEPALRRALEAKPPLEVRRRLEEILQELAEPVPCPEYQRSMRTLEALEHMGTPAARRLVQALAQGASDARLTQAATASLQRLNQRHPLP